MRVDSLLVRGPFHGPSGYDHHTREFVRELVRQGIAVQLVDVPEWGPTRLSDERRDPWFDALGRDVGARIALHFTMPHQVIPYPGLLNVNYTMFEATHVHPTWIAHGSSHDRVIVPTASSRDAWVASGLDPGRLRVSPLGIDPTRFAGDSVPLDLTTDDGRPIKDFRVRFLNIAEVSPRKNHAGLLRAWLQATSREDDAILILKLGLYSPGWQDFWDQMVTQVEHETGRHLADAAPICRLHAIYADDEMPRLYAAASHYISLSHGEGWDQPMVEAAAAGLRLIAPDHSAYRFYLDADIATLVPSREVPARFEGGGPIGLLFAGASWWEPDADAATAAICAAIERRDVPRRLARERVLRALTWERATARLTSLLQETADDGSGRHPVFPRLFWRRSGVAMHGGTL